MRASAERLAEIDRELEAFGKSEDELRAVIERARSWAASVDDAELDALARGAHEAAARARATRDSYPPAAPSEPAPSSPDIAGLSVDELFADAEPSTGAADSAGLSDLFDDEHTPAGARPDDGLGDLFDDELAASPDAPAPSGLADLFDDDAPAGERSELADLFDDDEPAASSTPVDAMAGPGDEDAPRAASPSEGLADLFDDEATAEDELRNEPSKSVKSVPPPWPAAELAPFSDEDDEVTGSFSADEVAKLEAQAAGEPDELELFVEEDVLLELDEEELEQDAIDGAADDASPGLISRILGRK